MHKQKPQKGFDNFTQFMVEIVINESDFVRNIYLRFSFAFACFSNRDERMTKCKNTPVFKTGY